MKKKKGNKWADHYTRQAKKDKYPARSVYKLQEMQQKSRLIKKGDVCLDLGCAPGSWLLYAAEAVGPKGKVIGIDLKPVKIKTPPQVTVTVGDILDMEKGPGGTLEREFNVVLSDMAPGTTGIKDVDAARSLYLCQAALEIAKRVLLPGGTFVCKIFQGEDFKEFSDSVKEEFNKNKIFKPKSCRKGSKEIYIIGLDKR